MSKPNDYDTLSYWLEKHDKGEITIYRSGRVDNLEVAISDKGYWVIPMAFELRIRFVLLHRLIWSAFNGIPPDDKIINHINGDKLEPRLSNLEAITQQQNCIHAYQLGLAVAPKGSRHGRSVYSEDVVHKMRKLRHNGASTKSLIQKFGGSQVTANRVLRGIGYDLTRNIEIIPKNKITKSLDTFIRKKACKHYTLQGLLRDVLEVSKFDISRQSLARYLADNEIELKQHTSEADIVAMRKSGKTAIEVADELGRSRQSVFRILKKHGLTENRRILLSDDQLEYIKKMQFKMSQQKLADKFGVSQVYIGRLLKKITARDQD